MPDLPESDEMTVDSPLPAYAEMVCNALGVKMADVIAATATLYMPRGKYKVCMACPICPDGQQHNITGLGAKSKVEARKLARRRHLRGVHRGGRRAGGE